MPDAEWTGAEFLEADDGGEIIEIGSKIGARLPDPESRFDHRGDPRLGHGDIVVGGAGYHVGVGGR